MFWWHIHRWGKWKTIRDIDAANGVRILIQGRECFSCGLRELIDKKVYFS